MRNLKRVMRERLPLLRLLAGAAILLTTPAAAEDKTIVAIIDQARLVKIPAGTQTLVIGNPTVADVTLLKQNNLMVLTPRSFGETNFIALDSQGNPVAESMIRVVGGGSAIVVQRGMDRQSYSCAPMCQPTERLGDDDKYVSAVASQTQAHTRALVGGRATDEHRSSALKRARLRSSGCRRRLRHSRAGCHRRS